MKKQYIYEKLVDLVECNIYRNNQSHYVRCPILRLLC